MVDNYLVAFHETFHHWQSVFTTYGHLKWGCDRSYTEEVINLWLAATENEKTHRKVPAASLIPSADIRKVSCVSQMLVQDIARQLVSLTERAADYSYLKHVLPINIDDITPIINLNGAPYHLNGIDILESFAKFQEAILGYIVEGKPISETIDKRRLRPEYYSALNYFIERVGYSRILEFPIICELALTVNHLCMISSDHNWKSNHPAWRYIKLIDIIADYQEYEYLEHGDIKDRYAAYVEMTLLRCGFASVDECWESAKEYATQTDLNIPRDMLRAIEFKRKYPWILAFPLIDNEVFQKLIEFHPYYYIMSNETAYAVSSDSLGNEVIFENHYQAFAHQLCGHISQRCIDCGRIQCGFSYYGLSGCQYQVNGTCDGHVDRNSELPKLLLDADGNIIEGCLFEAFLSLMGVRVSDLEIIDLSKKIDASVLSDSVKKLHLK